MQLHHEPSRWRAGRCGDQQRIAGGDTLAVAPGSDAVVRWWVVQVRAAGVWETYVRDGSARAFILAGLLRNPSAPAELIAVTAVDRVGHAGAASALRLR